MRTPAPPRSAVKSRTPFDRRHRRSSAFTLVEVLVVTLVIGLLAGSAALSLVGRARSATLDDAVRRVGFLDAVTRRSARHSGRQTRVSIDLDRGTITVAGPDGGGAGETAALGSGAGEWALQLRLPAGQNIARVWVAAARPAGDAAAGVAECSGGKVTLPCSADGYTPTYGLLIQGPGGSAGRIAFAGLTGEAHRFADDEGVRSLFAALAAGGTLDGDARAGPEAGGARAP